MVVSMTQKQNFGDKNGSQHDTKTKLWSKVERREKVGTVDVKGNFSIKLVAMLVNMEIKTLSEQSGKGSKISND